MPDTSRRPAPLPARLRRCIRRYRWLYAAVLLAVLLFSGGSFILRSRRTAHALLTLNYEAAARGLFPDQTRFSTALLSSDAVLERAIARAGLTGQLAPEDLAGQISALPSAGSAQQTGTGYPIATTYIITYRRSPGLSRNVSTREMLRCLLEAYQEVFSEEYGGAAFRPDPDWTRCGTLEYREAGSFLANESTRLRRFLLARAAEDSSFRSSAGESFASLCQQLEDLIRTDLGNYDAYVLQSGLSRDREQDLAKLGYQDLLRSFAYQQAQAGYENRLQAIALCDASLARTALDDLTAAAAQASADASNALEQLRQEEAFTRQLEAAAAASPEDSAAADAMLRALQEKLAALMEQARALNEEYVRSAAQDSLTISLVQPGVREVLAILWQVLALDAAAFVLLSAGLLLCGRFRARSGRRDA